MEGTNRKGFKEGKYSEEEGAKKISECKRGRDYRVEGTEVSSPFLPFRKREERNSNEVEIKHESGKVQNGS